jgi:hypothetical protein
MVESLARLKRKYEIKAEPTFLCWRDRFKNAVQKIVPSEKGAKHAQRKRLILFWQPAHGPLTCGSLRAIGISSFRGGDFSARLAICVNAYLKKNIFINIVT